MEKLLSPKLGINRKVDLKYGIDKVSEREFNDWMESIVFVDKDWNPLPVILTEDESDDPENDRK